METQGPGTSSDFDRLENDIDKLDTVIPGSDREKQLTLANTRMWIAIQKDDKETALENFEQLVDDAKDEEEPPGWLTKSLLGAARRLSLIISDDEEDVL